MAFRLRKQVSTPVAIVIVTLLVVQLVFVNANEHTRKMAGWFGPRRMSPSPPPPPIADQVLSEVKFGSITPSPEPGPFIP